MLNLYIKEFIGIGTHLQKNPENIKNDSILIEKSQLCGLLDRNKYDTADNKIKNWKKLGWIETDKDRHMTKRVYVGEEKRYKRFISINLIVLKTLKTLNGE